MVENPYAATSTPLDRKSDNANGVILASRFKRFVARFIDDLLSVTLVVICLLLFVGVNRTMDILLGPSSEQFAVDPMIFLFNVTPSTITSLAVSVAMTFLLQGYLLHHYGQTIGKRLLRLKIVDSKSGTKPPLMTTFVIRECGMSVLGFSTLLMSINVLWIFGPPRKCIHDYWSNTKVVKAN